MKPKSLTPAERAQENIIRILKKYEKDCISERIKEGIAAKKLNKK